MATVIPSLEQLHHAVDSATRGQADDLAPLVLAISHHGDADLIARTSQALLAADPRMWLALDISARKSWWHAPEWTDTVARRLVADQPGPLDLLLAACHPDGFVREAAVAAISELDDVTALPTLALRAADWVPEVRDRARRACRRYLDHAPIEAITFLASVALALRARQTGSWLADAVDDLLRDGPPEALNTALAATNWRIRRAAHLIGLKAGRLSVDQMLQAALSLRQHADSLDEHTLRPLLDQAHPHHVRTAAYHLLRTRDTWTRVSLDLQLISDPVPAIRTEARADLTNWLTRDAATTYSAPHGPRSDELSALLIDAEAVLGPTQTRLLRFHMGLPR